MTRHDDPAVHEIAAFLADRGWLAPDERVLAVGPAGDGNMNEVQRVTTDRGTRVLKRAFPYVAKFPQFAAPPERAAV